jgi:hypothetical protein
MKFSAPKLRSVKLRKMNISDTIFFKSSIEAPKLQKPPKTFVPSTKKTITERTAQKWFARYFEQGNFDMSGTQRSSSHVVHLVGYGGHCLL